jgi:polar amino acid transport system permease protein
MATDPFAERRQSAFARVPPGLYGVVLIIGAGLLLWTVTPAEGARGETFARLIQWAPALALGFSVNVLISIGAIAIGTAIGLTVGTLALPTGIAGRFARLWIVAFRNAPWLVLIYFTTYVFPFEVHVFGKVMPFPDWLKVVLALALPASANIAEVLRGAIRSIPSAQWEAAASLAFSRRQVLFTIILPQCVRRILPPWMNVYALITMGTALSSLVGIHDLLDTAQIASSTVARSSFTILTYVSTLVVFFLYCGPIAWFTRWLEHRLKTR